MRIVHRVAAAFAGIILLQYSLLGSGTLCAMRAPSHQATNGTDCDGPKQSDPGRAPCTTTACASMTACTSAPSLVTASFVAATGTVIVAELPEPLSAESELAITPEPPPPRA